MALTASTMLPLGTAAPDFALPDVVTGRTVSLDDYRGRKALLVMFICRHCPFVRHVQGELARIGRDYAGRGAGIVAISANDAASHPDDAPASLAEMAREQAFAFPLCHDESQAVAKAYRAVCTPDYFIFDEAAPARLSRAARRQPARQRRSGDRARPARGPRCVARGPPCRGRATSEHRLQHQVEGRQRGVRCAQRTPAWNGPSFKRSEPRPAAR